MNLTRLAKSYRILALIMVVLGTISATQIHGEDAMVYATSTIVYTILFAVWFFAALISDVVHLLLTQMDELHDS